MIDGTWTERRKQALSHLKAARELARMGDRECALHLAWAGDCGPDVLSQREMDSVRKAFQASRLAGVAPAEQGLGGWHHRVEKVEATGAPVRADLPKVEGKVPAKGRSRAPAVKPARPVLVSAVPRGVESAKPAGAGVEAVSELDRLAAWAGGRGYATSVCEWIEGVGEKDGRILEQDGFRWSGKRSAWWRGLEGYQRPAKSA